mmetsp:Transcript_137/g.414  ORF Transcript_137/g.414 Transcript_137/m.414 type:complete len:332 (-) Transcript_137:47-1042(-)
MKREGFSAVVIFHVLGWFAANIGLALSNKVLMNGRFQKPVALTTLHMCASVFFTTLAMELDWVPKQPLQSRRQAFNVACLSLSFSFSVVFGVASLQFIPISFEQAIGSTTCLWTALFSLLILRRWEGFGVYGALVVVAIGMAIASWGEPSFNLLGFALVVGAAALRGLKSVLQEVLVSGEGEKLDSFNSLRWMACFAILWLAPAAYLLEGPTEIGIELSDILRDRWATLAFIVNCSGAFVVNVFSFLVTHSVGAIAMQVLGSLKNVLSAGLSVAIFRNAVTPMGAAGFALTTLGAAVFQREQQKYAAETKLLEDASPRDPTSQTQTPLLRA